MTKAGRDAQARRRWLRCIRLRSMVFRKMFSTQRRGYAPLGRSRNAFRLPHRLAQVEPSPHRAAGSPDGWWGVGGGGGGYSLGGWADGGLVNSRPRDSTFRS